MNMKNISLLSLLFVMAGFVSAEAARRKVDMSRVKEELGQIENQFNLVEPKYRSAVSKLMATKKGKLYRQAERVCDEAENCNTSPDFQEASRSLKQTEEYINEFLPIEKEFLYIDYKRFGLEQMVRYVADHVDRSDVGAMYSGLNSALYVDVRAGGHKTEIRDRVYNELSKFIRTEDRILVLQEAESSMPTYQ